MEPCRRATLANVVDIQLQRLLKNRRYCSDGRNGSNCFISEGDPRDAQVNDTGTCTSDLASQGQDQCYEEKLLQELPMYQRARVRFATCPEEITSHQVEEDVEDSDLEYAPQRVPLRGACAGHLKDKLSQRSPGILKRSPCRETSERSQMSEERKPSELFGSLDFLGQDSFENPNQQNAEFLEPTEGHHILGQKQLGKLKCASLEDGQTSLHLEKECEAMQHELYTTEAEAQAVSDAMAKLRRKASGALPNGSNLEDDTLTAGVQEIQSSWRKVRAMVQNMKLQSHKACASISALQGHQSGDSSDSTDGSSQAGLSSRSMSSDAIPRKRLGMLQQERDAAWTGRHQKAKEHCVYLSQQRLMEEINGLQAAYRSAESKVAVLSQLHDTEQSALHYGRSGSLLERDKFWEGRLIALEKQLKQECREVQDKADEDLTEARTHLSSELEQFNVLKRKSISQREEDRIQLQSEKAICSELRQECCVLRRSLDLPQEGCTQPNHCGQPQQVLVEQPALNQSLSVISELEGQIGGVDTSNSAETALVQLKDCLAVQELKSQQLELELQENICARCNASVGQAGLGDQNAEKTRTSRQLLQLKPDMCSGALTNEQVLQEECQFLLQSCAISEEESSKLRTLMDKEKTRMRSQLQQELRSHDKQWEHQVSLLEQQVLQECKDLIEVSQHAEEEQARLAAALESEQSADSDKLAMLRVESSLWEERASILQVQLYQERKSLQDSWSVQEQVALEHENALEDLQEEKAAQNQYWRDHVAHMEGKMLHECCVLQDSNKTQGWAIVQEEVDEELKDRDKMWEHRVAILERKLALECEGFTQAVQDTELQHACLSNELQAEKMMAQSRLKKALDSQAMDWETRLKSVEIRSLEDRRSQGIDSATEVVESLSAELHARDTWWEDRLNCLQQEMLQEIQMMDPCEVQDSTVLQKELDVACNTVQHLQVAVRGREQQLAASHAEVRSLQLRHQAQQEQQEHAKADLGKALQEVQELQAHTQASLVSDNKSLRDNPGIIGKLEAQIEDLQVELAVELKRNRAAARMAMPCNAMERRKPQRHQEYMGDKSPQTCVKPKELCSDRQHLGQGCAGAVGQTHSIWFSPSSSVSTIEDGDERQVAVPACRSRVIEIDDIDQDAEETDAPKPVVHTGITKSSQNISDMWDRAQETAEDTLGCVHRLLSENGPLQTDSQQPVKNDTCTLPAPSELRQAPSGGSSSMTEISRNTDGNTAENWSESSSIGEPKVCTGTHQVLEPACAATAANWSECWVRGLNTKEPIHVCSAAAPQEVMKVVSPRVWNSPSFATPPEHPPGSPPAPIAVWARPVSPFTSSGLIASRAPCAESPLVMQVTSMLSPVPSGKSVGAPVSSAPMMLRSCNVPATTRIAPDMRDLSPRTQSSCSAMSHQHRVRELSPELRCRALSPEPVVRPPPWSPRTQWTRSYTPTEVRAERQIPKAHSSSSHLLGRSASPRAAIAQMKSMPSSPILLAPMNSAPSGVRTPRLPAPLASGVSGMVTPPLASIGVPCILPPRSPANVPSGHWRHCSARAEEVSSHCNHKQAQGTLVFPQGACTVPTEPICQSPMRPC